MTTLVLDSIPQPLKDLPQWLVWRREERGGKITKVPYNPATGALASVTNAADWATFEEAVAASSKYDGIGFVLTADDPFTGIDLDHCYDPKTGVIEPWALAIVDQLFSYTERSPSGTGLRIFVKGTLIQKGRKKGPIEFYDAKRYLTLTGNHLADTPVTIEDRHTTLQLVHETHFPPAKRDKSGDGPSYPIATDDETQLARMFQSTHGEKIQKLWNGDWSNDYPSQSEADSALCFHLAYWFGRDPERMDRLFRCSKLMRDKWDSPRGESTYGRECVANARAKTTDTFQQVPKIVTDMNARYAVVWMGGDCVILREHTTPDTGLVDVSFCSKQAVKLFHTNEVKMGKLNQVEYWLRHPNRRTYDGLVFHPGPTPYDPKLYNLWHGFAVEAKEGNCNLYLEHLYENIVCRNDEHYRYTLAWMANVVQNPGYRPGVAIVMRGGQGTGKGIFTKLFGGLFRPHFAHITNSHQLVGRFNALLKKAIVVFADEAFWAGDRQAEGTLNALITEETHNIELKGIDPITVKNYMHLIIASNHDWVVPAGNSARRFFFLDVSEEHRQDHAYFEPLADQMQHGGSAALLHYLLHYKYTGVNLRQIPLTVGLVDQKIHSMTPIVKFWFGCLEAGSQLGGQRGYAGGGEYHNEKGWETVISVSALYGVYVEQSRQVGVTRRSMEMELANVLKRMAPGVIHRRLYVNGTQKRAWKFPPLKECRAAFDQYMNWTYQWPSIDDIDDQKDKVVSPEMGF